MFRSENSIEVFNLATNVLNNKDKKPNPEDLQPLVFRLDRIVTKDPQEKIKIFHCSAEVHKHLNDQETQIEKLYEILKTVQALEYSKKISKLSEQAQAFIKKTAATVAYDLHQICQSRGDRYRSVKKLLDAEFQYYSAMNLLNLYKKYDPDAVIRDSVKILESKLSEIKQSSSYKPVILDLANVSRLIR